MKPEPQKFMYYLVKPKSKNPNETYTGQMMTEKQFEDSNKQFEKMKSNFRWKKIC